MGVRTGIRVAGLPLELTEDADSLTIESEGTRDLILNAGSGKVGIGTSEPERTLHVTKNAAADPQYALNQPVIIEDATRPGIQLVGSANNIGLIEFGDNAHANAGSINFDHSTNRLRFGFEDDAEKVYIDSSGDMVISGNLAVGDKLIELGNGVTGTPSGDAGIIIERGSSTNAAIVWDESRDEFVLGTTSATGASTGDLTVTPGNISVERIGAGTEQAEAEVHAKRDTASGVQYSTTATVIAEDDSRPSIQLAGAANNIGLIQFGDNAAVASGQIYYDHSTDKLRIDAGGNGDRVTVDADGDVVIAGDITLTGGGALQVTTQDADLTFKGNDGGSTVTALSLDMSAAGAATFSGDVTVTGEVIASAGIDVKNGSTGPGYVNFYEDSDNGTNSVTVIGPASTGDVTLTLPSATDTLVGKATTDTLTNKTLTSPVLTTPRIADDGYIADGAGNEQLVFVQEGSAVNHWAMTNATSGSPMVTLQAVGDTSDVNAVIKPQGEGIVAFIMTHANSVVAIKGAEGGEATLQLQADEGDDDPDKWLVSATTDGHFLVESKISGSYADMFDINASGSADPGAGFNTSGGVTSYISKLGAEIVTTIHVDLGAAAAVSTTNNEAVIGETGAADAWITQISSARSGVIYRVEMSCIETPTTGQADIDLVGNSGHLDAGDLFDSAGSEIGLIEAGGAWALGMSQSTTSRQALAALASDYLYLACGASGTAGAYGAGQFIIKLYGAAAA